MSEITDITEQIKDKRRCNIYVDGRFCCGLKLETVMKNRLKKGVEISEEELSALQLESEKSDALDKALNYISRSMKTEKDVRSYLSKKGYLDDVVSYAVEKMRSYGYIDDNEYSLQFARNNSNNSSKRLIEQKLRLKGVDEGSIASALENIDDEDETAYKILSKYMRSKEYTRENIQRGIRHLVSKGFDYDTAKRAMGRVGGDCEDI